MHTDSPRLEGRSMSRTLCLFSKVWHLRAFAAWPEQPTVFTQNVPLLFSMKNIWQWFIMENCNCLQFEAIEMRRQTTSIPWMQKIADHGPKALYCSWSSFIFCIHLMLWLHIISCFQTVNYSKLFAHPWWFRLVVSQHFTYCYKNFQFV